MTTEMDWAAYGDMGALCARLWKSRQFSLRTLLLFVAGVAFYLALATTIGPWMMLPATFVAFYALMWWDHANPPLSWLLAAQSQGIALMAAAYCGYEVYGIGVAVSIFMLGFALCCLYAGSAVVESARWRCLLGLLALLVAGCVFAFTAVPSLRLQAIRCEAMRIADWAERHKTHYLQAPPDLAGFHFHDARWQEFIEYQRDDDDLGLFWVRYEGVRNAAVHYFYNSEKHRWATEAEDFFD